MNQPKNAEPLSRAFSAPPMIPPLPEALPQAGIEAASSALNTRGAAEIAQPISTTSQSSLGRERSLVRALFLAALVPAIFIVICVSKYGVNVPYGDEWLMIPFLAKDHDHQLTWADLYQQHNEHRIVIPKAVYLAFARFTHWNLHAEMYFSIALCLATSAGIYQLLRRTLQLSQTKLLLLWIACNLFIFSPTQAENWLWGFQLQMFIPNLCLVGALLALNMDRGWTTRFSIAAVATAIATFSFGNGLLLWPTGALCLLLRKERLSHVATWTALFVVIAAVYFIGYVPAPKAHPLTGGWVDYPLYFSVFLGGTLARDGFLLRSVTTGIAALTLFGFVATYFLRFNGPTLRRAAPWIAMGSYAVASAALAAWTRVHGGPAQAGDSRYITISQNLYLALLALFTLVGASTELGWSKIGDWIRSAKVPVITALIVLLLMSFPAGIAHMEVLQRFTGTGLAALQFSRTIDTRELLGRQLLLPIQIKEPTDYIATLERLGYLDNRFGTDGNLKDGEDRPVRATTEFGATNEVRSMDSHHLQMRGWAFLRDRDEAAPAVVLAVRDGARCLAFDICKTGESRRDLAERFRSRSYLTTGWSRTFSRDKLPPNAEIISAWAVDPFAAKTYKLPVDFRVPK